MGDGGARRLHDLHRHRRDVLARGVPAADHRVDRLVDDGGVDRHDAQLPRDGCGRLRLGRVERPHRPATRGPRGRGAPGLRPLPREPCADRAPVPAQLRPAGRHRRRQLLLADDRRRHGLDQRAPRPRRVAGLGRRRCRADDHVAVRSMAHHADGLAGRAARHRGARLGDARSGGAFRAPASAVGPTAAEGPRTSLRDAFFSAPFVVLALTFFACCAAHAGPIFHTVTYAMTCGIAPLAAVTVYSVEGLAGLGGRLALGVAADRLGVKRVLIAGLVIQALAAFAFISASRLGEFYAVAAIFGFAYGGVMPLYAVLAREYFGQRILGAVFGAAAMVSSLGMAAGPAIGGWIFDTFGQYTWMYIYSGTIGLGAVAIALAFPPFPGAARGASPAAA